MTTFFRICRNVSSSLWRNRVAALFSIIGLSLVFFLAHLSTFVGTLSDLVIDNIERKVDIAVFIDREATDTKVDAFRSELVQKQAKGEIIGFWELTREDALEEFRRKFPDETQFLERYEIDNPLTTVFGIVPIAEREGTENVVHWLRSENWRGVIDPETFRKNDFNKAKVDRFLGMTRLAKETVTLFWAVFIAVAFFLVFYTVLLVVKSNFREMTVMRLVGANMSYIRLPYVIEGVVIAVVALLVSVLLFNWTVTLIEGVLLGIVSEFEIKSTFLTDFFARDGFLFAITWDNGLLLILSSLLAALFAVEYALRRKDMFSDF